MQHPVAVFFPTPISASNVLSGDGVGGIYFCLLLGKHNKNFGLQMSFKYAQTTYNESYYLIKW